MKEKLPASKKTRS